MYYDGDIYHEGEKISREASNSLLMEKLNVAKNEETNAVEVSQATRNSLDNLISNATRRNKDNIGSAKKRQRDNKIAFQK